MFRGVLVTFPPERRGGKIVPVNIEGVPDKYGRFEIDNSDHAYHTMDYFDHEMRRKYERMTPSFGFDLSYEKSEIERVIFNDPATIVIWKDKTKTVVKCQEGDTYSPELGLAMCISKKYLGNKGNFNEVFKKWIPKKKPIELPPEWLEALDSGRLAEAFRDTMYRCGKALVEMYEPKTEPTTPETSPEPEEYLKNEIPKIGTKIRIIDTKNGCTGAIGRIGIVTDEPVTNGLLFTDPGYNVEISEGVIWRINPDAKIEILE